MAFWRGKRNSIVFKISLIVTMVMAAMIVLLILYNVYSFSTASQNMREQQLRIMSVHAQRIGTVLLNATVALDELVLDNLGQTNALLNASAIRKYIVSIDLAGLLSTRVDRNPHLACLYFLYGEADVSLTRYSSVLGWKQKFLVEDYLHTHGMSMENDVASNEWHVLNLAGSSFLLQNYRLGAANIGVLIYAEDLLGDLQGTGDMQSAYVLTDEAGKILASENTKAFCVGDELGNDRSFLPDAGEYVLFTEELSRYGLRLSCAIPRMEFYAGLERIQYLLCGLGAAALLAMVAIARFLNRNVVDPVKDLAQATQELREGNVDYRIPTEKAYAQEFSDLIQMFNSMTQEITDLKIQNYEEALERKNAQLKYLQLQLHPHFYLNAITTISSLSMRGENEQIQRFIEVLSIYLRYLFTDNQRDATVQSEIRHAEDYIRLQQISYADHVFYYTAVDPRVAEVPMQKLLVQTFVENIFKHAFDGEESISIFIRGSMEQREDGAFARITIEDTGCGFPQEFLDKMSGSDGVENVGIYNVCRTMEFTYGRKDLIQIGNNEQGSARITIDIPFAPQQEEKRGNERKAAR